MFWISRGIKKWFQWRKALIGGDCSGMLRFCAPLGHLPSIFTQLHINHWKQKEERKPARGTVGNTTGKNNTPPILEKRMPQIKTQRFKLIFLAGLLFSSLSKVWGLLHHWRLWLPTTNSTASQEDEPNKLPNSLSVIRSHCRPYLVEGKKKNGGETVFRVFHGRPQLFSSSPLCFFFFVFFSATDHLGRCTLHLR